jgi:hypothetical protein
MRNRVLYLHFHADVLVSRATNPIFRCEVRIDALAGRVANLPVAAAVEFT